MSAYDVIMIPGGGVRQRGQLPLWSQRRIERALEIQTTEFILCLSAGTIYKPPPINLHGHPIYESVAAAHHLLDKGIEPKRILVETCSYDTIGNAFFSKIIHIDPLSLRRILIITSAFHMPRTKAIFDWIYSLEPINHDYILEYETVSDAGIDEALINARRKKERKSLEKLLGITQQVKTLGQFHHWLFSEHEIYSIARLPQRKITRNTLESY